MSEPSEKYWVDRPLEIMIEGDCARQISLSQPFALVGSGKGCDVVLPDAGLPPRCFFACVTHQGLLGATLAHPRSNVARSFAPIDANRGIRFGRRRLRFQVAEAIPTHAQSESANAKRHFIRWKDQGKKHFATLKPGRLLLLGRSAPSAIRIRDNSISSVHAAIYHEADSLWIIDLNSTNGTFLDRKRIRCGEVQAGTDFHVGTTRIQFGRHRDRTGSSSTIIAMPSSFAGVPDGETPPSVQAQTSDSSQALDGDRSALTGAGLTLEMPAAKPEPTTTLDEIIHESTTDEPTSEAVEEPAAESTIDAAALEIAAANEAKLKEAEREATELQERLTFAQAELENQRAVILEFESKQQQWEANSAEFSTREAAVKERQQGVEQLQRELDERQSKLEQEREGLTADAQKLAQQSKDLEEQIAKLNERESELESASEQLDERRISIESASEELTQRQAEFESQQTRFMEESRAWEQEHDVLASELGQTESDFQHRVAEQTAALYEEREKIDQAYEQLGHDRSELERCSREVAAQLKQTKLDLKQQKIDLKRESELLVIHRIRTQRGLKAREAAVVEAEKELEERKTALLALEQRVQRQQEELAARHRRYVPPEEGLVRSPVEVVNQRPKSEDSLLESADFTELLQDFISKRK